MAITVATGVTTASSLNTTSYTTASFTPTADEQLIAFVVATDTLDAGSMTDTQSLGWTRIGFQTWSNSTSKLYVFIANALAINASMTATFNCAGDAATGCLIHIVRVKGNATPAGAYVQIKSNFEDPITGSSPSVTMDSAIDTDNCIIGVACNTSLPSVITEPSGFTELVDSGYGNPATGFESAYKISGTTGTTVSWTQSPDTQSWVAVAIELGIAGGGGGGGGTTTRKLHKLLLGSK
jgi:hypothetical protein